MCLDIIIVFIYVYRFRGPFLSYLGSLLGYSFVHRVPRVSPNIYSKIAQNARKARLRPGTLPGWILVSFLVDFGCRFGIVFGHILIWFSTFLATMHKYAQIQAQRRNDAQNTCKCWQITRKYAQIHANTRKYVQVHAHTCKYAQIPANTSKYTQIHTNFVFYRVTSAARERAQRAQRAKRRKHAASSHEQVQRATCSSMRRHVLQVCSW